MKNIIESVFLAVQDELTNKTLTFKELFEAQRKVLADILFDYETMKKINVSTF